MGQNNNISKILYGLFYWKENNHYIFSRTKFLTLIVFFVIFIYGLQDWNIFFALFMGLLFAIPVFIIGFLIHKFMDIDSSFYNGNLIDDIKHFLFYWYDGQNKFSLSKTKSITLIIIAIGLLSGLKSAIPGQYSGIAFANTVMSLMFAVPAFLIGFAIHKSKLKNNGVQSVSTYKTDEISNKSLLKESNDKNLKINSNVDKSNISPKFNEYMLKIDELKKEFDKKELTTKELIATKFTPPQITYDRFISVVDNCSTIFNEEYTAVSNLISYSKDDSAKIDDEINSKIDTLQSFIDKLDELSSELVINISKSKNDDVEDALIDIENLISSINNYED